MSFHVIKENDLFLVSDSEGFIPEPTRNEFGHGLYMHDTRVLSEFHFTATPKCWRPISADSSNNYESVYRYTNTAFNLQDGTRIADQSALLTRRQFTDGRGFCEWVTVVNYTDHPFAMSFVYQLDADFADMFEVRGVGSSQAPRAVQRQLQTDGGAVFTYQAADNTLCQIQVQPFTDSQVKLGLSLVKGHVQITVCADILPHSEQRWGIGAVPNITTTGAASVDSFTGSGNVSSTMRQGLDHMEQSYQEWFSSAPQLTGHRGFQTWYERGLRDMRMLVTDLGFGEFPVAGVPWYAVPFGRDSIITSIQTLMANPGLAKGTLCTMAHYQGTALNPSRDEQPGKIMHELRAGELSRTGRVPFDPYYGTIDATPLFLVLAVDYYDWTGDKELIKDLLPTVRRALKWLEQYGDRDGDGFVEYLREAEGGIANQGWKDSGDSVTHKDGSLAHGSIALCEVQGYVYRAYRGWAAIFQEIGDFEEAARLSQAAGKLQSDFVKAFWMEDEQAVAIGLDGAKQPIRSVSSNMGQVLWSGILPQEYANKVIDRLLQPDMNSGYGIRTLSSGSVRYNPISYHNGSVWPHDNSIIVAGMAKYRRLDAVHEVVKGLMHAGEGFPLFRLPELFAGMSSDEVKQPVPYPVSCSPQAWAAATPIFVLQSLLGMVPSVSHGRVAISPSLPEYIPSLTIVGIPVGSGRLSVEISRSPNGQILTKVISNETGLEVDLLPVGEVMTPAP